MADSAFITESPLAAIFKALPHSRSNSPFAGKRVVVVGGGTGAPMSIRCLLSLGVSVDAVVAMADDGGSTGELRQQAGVTPPGDVRKCLAAFAAHPDDDLAKAFQYRFPFADNHALGNLLLAALEDAAGSFPAAIEVCEHLLKARGHVYPSTLTHVEMSAQTVHGDIVEGQAVACHSKYPLRRAWLQPTHIDEHVEPYKPALRALQQADVIVLGPGSLYTSIIANLLVPGIVQAIQESKALVVYVSAVSDSQGESHGFSIADQVEALRLHGLEGRIDMVLADQPRQNREAVFPRGMKRISLTKEDEAYLTELGIKWHCRDFYNEKQPDWHSPSVLRNAFKKVLS